MSKQLFPEQHPCAGSLLEISDIRPLADGTALALFKGSESWCGEGQLARLSAENLRLRVQRIDVAQAIDGVPSTRGPRAGVDSIFFGDARGAGYGYSNLAATLEAQRKPSSDWVLVPLASAHAKHGRSDLPRQTVAIDLRDLSLHNLGDGEVVRFVDSDSTALMTLESVDPTSGAFLQFKAVRVSDGSVLDRATLPLRCFSITGASALAALESDLMAAKAASSAELEAAEHHYEETAALDKTITDQRLKDEFNYPQIVASLARHRDAVRTENVALLAASLEGVANSANLDKAVQWLHDDAVARALLARSKEVEWNANTRRLDAKISGELTRARCN